MATKAIIDSTNVPQNKRALTIGIEEYDGSNKNLPNAVRDAKGMSSALTSIGFIIDEPKINLKYEEMRLALVTFECSIKPGDMVLFYFAGHGIQWEDQNYLIPAGVSEISGLELAQCAINAQDILDMISIRKPLVTIFILDCCRTYHLRNEQLEGRVRGETPNQIQGLKPMSNKHESLIIFACAAGATAIEGATTETNGLFTKHLLRHIETPNQHVMMMLFDVIKGVKDESKSKQIPFFNGSLTNKNISLNEQALKHNIHQSAVVGKDDQVVKIPDSSQIHFSSSKKSDDVLELIKAEIIQLLQLDCDDDITVSIVNDLIKKGRQSLTNYQDHIIPEIYKQQINNSDNELIKVLKKYFEEQWKTEYGSSNLWFVSFLEQCKSGENHYRYEHVLNRTVEYGDKYMKNCPILSIVVQLLFKDIDYKCLQKTNVFNTLWFTITTDGSKSIQKYSEYVVPDIMNEQINGSQLALFQALREYFRQELFQLLKQSELQDKQISYDLTLDSVAEHGWRNGIMKIRDKIPPKKFEILSEKMESFMQQKQTQQDAIIQMNDHSESLDNKKLTEPILNAATTTILKQNKFDMNLVGYYILLRSAIS